MAYGIMLKDRNSFHLNLLASFISVVGLYPPGNRVLLSDDRQATVTVTGHKIDRPTVRVTHAADGNELPGKLQQSIDLGAAAYRHLAVRELLQTT